jgi:hypothetical protein
MIMPPTLDLNAPPLQSQDLNAGDYILLGNDILMQWYSALNNKPIVPLQPTNVITTRQVQQTSTLLIVGVIVVAVVLLSRK